MQALSFGKECLGLHGASRSGMITAPQSQLDQNKADYMEYLYMVHGRGSAELGLLGTYTGLYDLHCEQIGKETVDQQVSNWHLEGSAIIADYLYGN